MEYTPIKWPAWRYSPTGEAKIFERAEDVPEGWEDNPNNFKKYEIKQSKGSPEGKSANDDFQSKKYPELREIAKGLGLEVKVGMKKTDLVELITAKLAEE